MKKTLSIILTILMIVSCIPIFASAAEPIALTTDNITEYPVANLINEAGAFVGMTVGESVTLSGGEVRYDSNGDGTLSEDEIVPGTFSIVDPDTVPNIGGNSNNRVSIKFTPADETLFTGFESSRDRNVQYYVQKVTPVFIDENDTVPVATSVPAGEYLSLSTLSGAAVTNPYNPNESRIITKTWTWDTTVNNPKKTVVNESGYYQARFVCPGYNTLTAQVWVEVTNNAVDTEIIESPTLKNVEVGKQWNDVTIEGGKTVVKGGTDEVLGSYSITKIIDVINSTSYNIEIIETTYEVEIMFTPDDLNNYRKCTTTVTVNVERPIVEKQLIKFVDENGEEIVPEISTIHNAVFGETYSINYSLNAYLNTNRATYEYFDAQGNSLMGTMVPVGTNEITVKVTSANEEYLENTLKFILTVEPKEFTVTPSYAFTSGKIKVIVDNKLNVPGEYDVYVNGELIGTTENKEVKWKTENSCTVDLELIHKDESGRYALTNGKQEFNISIPRYLITAEGSLSYSVSVAGTTGIAWNYHMGDVITLECTDAEFYAWSLSVGGEKYIPEGLTEEDLKNPVITFTMPDSDMGVSADTQDNFAADMDCSHLCHSENKVLQLFWKLINFFCQLFDIQQYCDCGITHYDAPLF